MPGMPMPSWYEEAKEQMASTSVGVPQRMKFQPAHLERIEDLPNLFAEYEIKGDHVLVHLFPRWDLTDKWTDGHYVNRCRNCHKEVEVVDGKPKVCSCGHSGLIYIPGRVEQAEGSFPQDARDLIKEACDSMWMGDVAIELIPELNAYVVQFQGAKTTAAVIGCGQFVRKMCESFNRILIRELAKVRP